uniref:Uncharacterized protein LOC116956635 n=1 Tax=Petromyzon marinus TaxID=7757 RepID=A0AAJ7XIA1_PETMA|nr:uncharacterized protein LOC116956635 [Petromyzon marinus]
MAVCLNCKDSDVVTYSWKLNNYKYNNLDTLTDTGVHSMVLEVKSNALLSGFSLIVQVEVTISGRSSTAVFQLTTNFPPYQGTCKMEHLEGIASMTLFTIICDGWLDEGDALLQNSVVDQDLGFFYQVSTLVRQRERIVHTSWIKEMRNLLLPVGDPLNDYSLLLSVYVCDIYTDCSIWKSPMKVHPPDVSGFENLASNIAPPDGMLWMSIAFNNSKIAIEAMQIYATLLPAQNDTSTQQVSHFHWPLGGHRSV